MPTWLKLVIGNSLNHNEQVDQLLSKGSKESVFLTRHLEQIVSHVCVSFG